MGAVDASSVMEFPGKSRCVSSYRGRDTIVIRHRQGSLTVSWGLGVDAHAEEPDFSDQRRKKPTATGRPERSRSQISATATPEHATFEARVTVLPGSTFSRSLSAEVVWIV